MEENNSNLHNELFNSGPDSTQFQYPRKNSLARSSQNVIIAGVCSGIAETYKFDVGIVRLFAMIALFFGGWIIAAYLITAFLLPVRLSIDTINSEQKLKQSRENFKTVLSGIFIVLGLHFALEKIGLTSSSNLFLLPISTMTPILMIGSGIFLLRNKNRFTLTNYSSIKFYRINEDRLFLGVCSGLAKYLDIDFVSLRIIYIILSILTLGVFVIIYFVIAFFTEFIPELTEALDE